MLRRDVVNAGGVSEWARQKNIDQASVSRSLAGASPPRPNVIKALGLVRRVDYVRAK